MILLIMSFLICSTIGFDYCRIESCAEEEHTMCKYPSDSVACADGDGAVLTDELRVAILDRHNWHRQQVAKGRQSPQPRASDMKELTWDDEVERIAQRWANQCVFAHDGCRNTENSTVGQNLATRSTNSASPNVTEAVVKMIDSWYAEVDDFDGSGVKKFKSGSGTGHYTQMVWAQTEAIGCGLVRRQRKSELVCNYLPAGNVLDEPIYTIGKPCSKCTDGSTCSRTYPGLCSKST